MTLQLKFSHILKFKPRIQLTVKEDMSYGQVCIKVAKALGIEIEEDTFKAENFKFYTFKGMRVSEVDELMGLEPFSHVFTAPNDEVFDGKACLQAFKIRSKIGQVRRHLI
jgi:hypothetical protein